MILASPSYKSFSFSRPGSDLAESICTVCEADVSHSRRAVVYKTIFPNRIKVALTNDVLIVAEETLCAWLCSILYLHMVDSDQKRLKQSLPLLV